MTELSTTRRISIAVLDRRFCEGCVYMMRSVKMTYESVSQCAMYSAELRAEKVEGMSVHPRDVRCVAEFGGGGYD